MRAELFPRTAVIKQFATVLLLAFIVSGCKTEKDPDQPTILGIPPAVAYLGVEYSYNFGAYGGEGILDYSLTNAPSWLALEETSNKARQGIIMRGVPGLSGGERGEADLGKQKNINLVSTDGRMAGFVPFDIAVKHNALSLEAATFTEGEPLATPDSNRKHCELPDLEPEGEHSFTINTYDADGSVNGTDDLTLPTRQVFVKVLLDQPSVTRVAVAFELESGFNPLNCDQGYTAEHQRCDHSRTNIGDAVIGQDIVAFGAGSDSLLETPPYLTYEPDTEGVYTGGVVTFEPGITECYIRLEVVDDSFPESTEIAQLRLTEVRAGLAALGATNAGIRANLAIEDNEPKVTLETDKGGTRDTLNVGDTRTYIARLTGERDGEIRAKLGHADGSTARLETEFTTNLTNDELVFAPGINKVNFAVTVDEGPYTNDDPDDRFILLGLDRLYQQGRENYARAESEEMLRISINELASPLTIGADTGFVATDVAVGHTGKLFVAGYDNTDNNRVVVHIYDQKGVLVQPPLPVSAAGDPLSAPEPVIGVAERKVLQGSSRTVRHEFVVAYSADEVANDPAASGGMDIVTSLYWYDETSNGGEYVETWTTRTGTSADDTVRWAGINSGNGFVVIAGETKGVWPGQTSAGGVDSFLQRIDSLPDGSDFSPSLAWTRQAGSSSDDHVAGASAAGLTPLLFGSAEGAVNGEPVIGGEDIYFYTAASADGDLSVHQRGTDADERVANGILAGSILWLLGNGKNEYTVNKDEQENLSLTSQTSSSVSGFLLGYTTGGDIVQSFNLNDEGDASKEQFTAIAGFDRDLVVAGSTDGDFTGDAGNSGSRSGIVARVSLVPDAGPEAETTVFQNDWRFQMNAADSEVTGLANYRDDEIVALVREGIEWKVLLFSPEGELLTPP
ncbi:hypothetical protein [Marinobacter salexigens]|uniref:hypothetical protein n=1 Tax=Marinobacter salexigens TaxID=1925763 RepID=UPI000C284E4B|nr:hypothetical protein [Marinobacter salexigens]